MFMMHRVFLQKILTPYRLTRCLHQDGLNHGGHDVGHPVTPHPRNDPFIPTFEDDDSQVSSPNETKISTFIKEDHVRPRTDPRYTSIILFPGLGSQKVGMGEKILDYPNVPEMFEAANRILGYDLLDICLNSTALNDPMVAEAAVFITSLGAAEKLRFERPSAITSCVGVSGMSVGELTALVFAGSIGFEDALRLIKLRSDGIHEVMSRQPPNGALSIVYGADGRINLAVRAASEWCIRKGNLHEESICSVSHYFFPHCKVISGHLEALNFIQTNSQDFGIKRCKLVPNLPALHTSIFKPVEKLTRTAMSRMKVMPPAIPVYSSLDAKMYRTEEGVRDRLPKLVSNPVRIEQVFHRLYSRSKDTHLPFSFECGTGSTLLTILEKVNNRARRQAYPVCK